MRETGIFITSIVHPPEGHGATVAVRCPICRTTIFMHDKWAQKPSDGDFFQITMCSNMGHNLELNSTWNEKQQYLLANGRVADVRRDLRDGR